MVKKYCLQASFFPSGSFNFSWKKVVARGSSPLGMVIAGGGLDFLTIRFGTAVFSGLRTNFCCGRGAQAYKSIRRMSRIIKVRAERYSPRRLYWRFLSICISPPKTSRKKYPLRACVSQTLLECVLLLKVLIRVYLSVSLLPTRLQYLTMAENWNQSPPPQEHCRLLGNVIVSSNNPR